MFEEESLYCRKYATRPSLLLEYPILDIFVKKEALAPGVVEITCLTLKQQLLDALRLLWS